jgi:hypothetical protein
MFQDGSQRGLIIEDGVITYPGGPLDRSPDLVVRVLPGLVGMHNHLSLASLSTATRH